MTKKQLKWITNQQCVAARMQRDLAFKDFTKYIVPCKEVKSDWNEIMDQLAAEYLLDHYLYFVVFEQ